MKKKFQATIFYTLLQFYAFVDFRFYLPDGFFMYIKRVDYRYFQAISSTSV